MIFQKGQKSKVEDLGLSNQLSIKIEISSNLSIDNSCFGVDQDNKLSDDRYMVFYNQKESPNKEIKLVNENPSTFEIDLSLIPEKINKIVFTSSIDGDGVMSKINYLKFSIGSNEFNLSGSDFQQEKAIIISELYKKDGVWRLGAVGQGFSGGLPALLSYFGGTSAEEAKPVTVAPEVKVDLKKKVFLEKRVNLEKTLESTSPKLLNLSKKAAVSLEKRGLGEHKAKVALCLDISISMTDLYKSGQIQEFAERILALGCRLDDDGSIDVFLFGEGGYQPAPLSVGDFNGYIQRMLSKNRLEPDTRYSAAIELVRKFYTPYKYERAEPLKLETPVYVMFLTDGQPSDKTPSTKALKNASYEPIFWQFMGIKGESKWSSPDFSYLEKLDDLTGRYIDNADFFSVESVSKMSDDELYNKLMNEYPKWLAEAKVKKLLD